MNSFACNIGISPRESKSFEKPTTEEATLERDRLTEDDWQVLQDVHKVLKPFKKITNRMEGYAGRGEKGALHEVLGSVDYVLTHMERKKSEYDQANLSEESCTPTSKALATSTNNSWVKLNQCYSLLDQSPAYYASIVTNPRLKWRTFDKIWASRKEWLIIAKDSVAALWNDYKDLAGIAPTRPSSFEAEEPDFFIEYMTAKQTPIQGDALKTYTDLPTDVNVTDLPAWWSNQEAQSQDPGLVKLAYDMLAIPAMSASCERLFSSAKLLLTDVRNRLDADHIEANECLKAWMNESS